VRFINNLKSSGIPVYTQPEIEGYPADVEKIVSAEGYGRNPFVETTKPLVIVTGAGPGAGRCRPASPRCTTTTCAGRRRGSPSSRRSRSGTSPLEHPRQRRLRGGDRRPAGPQCRRPVPPECVRRDRDQLQSDIENFSIMKEIIARIGDAGSPLAAVRSPTDMGVNMAREGIVDDAVVREAARQEIIRRLLPVLRECAQGIEPKETVAIVERLMQQVGREGHRPAMRSRQPPRGRACEGVRQREQGGLLRRCGGAQRRRDRLGDEYPAVACRVGGGAQRGEAARPYPGGDRPPLPVDHQ